MLSCTRANGFLPSVKLGGPCGRGKHYESFQRLVCCSSSKHKNFDQIGLGEGNLRFVCSPSANGRFGPVCLAKGNSKSENQGFSWESLKNAMGGPKQEESVQDWLKSQMRKNEFDGDGGDGDRPGGGGGGDGSGGEENEGISGILDELLQVILATIGFIFVYIYLIRGAELTRLARDYIKYLFGSTASVRLRRAMDRWGRFIEKITRTVDAREDWLERAIVATPTWWHKPGKLASLMRSRDGNMQTRDYYDDEDY